MLTKKFSLIYFCTLFEIIWLALQFASQNCLDCFSKLNLLLKIVLIASQNWIWVAKSRKSCSSFASYKIKNTTYLEYYILTIAIQLLYIVTQFTIWVAIFMQKLLLNCTKLFWALMHIYIYIYLCVCVCTYCTSLISLTQIKYSEPL